MRVGCGDWTRCGGGGAWTRRGGGGSSCCGGGGGSGAISTGLKVHRNPVEDQCLIAGMEALSDAHADGSVCCRVLGNVVFPARPSRAIGCLEALQRAEVAAIRRHLNLKLVRPLDVADSVELHLELLVAGVGQVDAARGVHLRARVCVVVEPEVVVLDPDAA